MYCSFRMIAMFVYLLGCLGSFLTIIKCIIVHGKVAHQMLLPLQKARFLLRLQSNNETTTTQSKRGNEVLHIWSANFWVTLVRFSSSKLYTTTIHSKNWKAKSRVPRMRRRTTMTTIERRRRRDAACLFYPITIWRTYHIMPPSRTMGPKIFERERLMTVLEVNYLVGRPCISLKMIPALFSLTCGIITNYLIDAGRRPPKTFPPFLDKKKRPNIY